MPRNERETAFIDAVEKVKDILEIFITKKRINEQLNHVTFGSENRVRNEWQLHDQQMRPTRTLGLIIDTENLTLSIYIDDEENVAIVLTGDTPPDLILECNLDPFGQTSMMELVEMLKQPTKTIKEWHEAHKEYDMDDDIVIDNYTMCGDGDTHIEIQFLLRRNIMFKKKDGLYVGFPSKDTSLSHPRHYVFKVKNKNVKNHGMVKYTAEFHGYYTPSEKELSNAKFGWVVSKDIIKQASQEARYN